MTRSLLATEEQIQRYCGHGRQSCVVEFVEGRVIVRGSTVPGEDASSVYDAGLMTEYKLADGAVQRAI